MENASKALIIAGAILLSILIISLGIIIFQQAKTTIGSANLDSTQIEVFNSEWDTYTARAQSAAEIKAMVNKLISHNATETNSGDGRYISIEFKNITGLATYDQDGLPAAVGTISRGLKNGTRYDVTSSYATGGLINKLTVSVQGASGGGGGGT